MDKPELKTITRHAYNWLEAEKWIEQKLGKPLRDYGCKFKGPNKDMNNPYWDYWHYILETQDVNNPCYIYISSEWLNDDDEDWQKEITQAFVDEFGDESEYYVEW